jgi:organic radical activating enzyme
MKYRIKRLDFNVAYACNLACKGCISLSDFDRRGVEPLQDIKEQCKTWSKILEPAVVSIFGGEPLLHPRLKQVLDLIRKSWPKALIRVITNGYLLRRYDPEMWFTFGPLEMQVSVHRQDHEPIITKEIKRIVKCRDTWSTYRSKSDGHRQLELHNKDLSIYKSKFKTFVMPYRLENGELRPFKSNPKKAHSICGSPDTPILYRNKLYKCAPLPNILELDKSGHYKYKGTEADGDVEGLVKKINRPETVCSMCPENLNHSIDHFKKENVRVKNIN